MDPNANLEEQREIRARLIEADGLYNGEDIERLVELSQALDDWLANGGFLPRAWAWDRPVRS